MIKTVRFANPRYLGDPINAVKLFSEKMADELILLDIEATARRYIDYDWLEDIVSEAFMPISYGGGINSIEQCTEIFRRGVEKIVINTAGCERPQLISDLAERFGSQSVIMSIDVRKNLWKRWRAHVRGGLEETKFAPVDLARTYEGLGAGEILITSIDREGTFEGYDVELLHLISNAVRIPVIANGGARSIDDFKIAVSRGGCSAVAASSIFVFAGKGEGVLINYPTEAELTDRFWSC